MYFNYLYFNYYTTLVLVVGVFLWGQIFAQWSNLPFLPSPKNIFFNGRYYYAALLPRRGPHIASHSVCLSVSPVIG